MVARRIENLSPYQGGKPIDELKRELALEKVIKLASNENPSPPTDFIKNVILDALKEVNRYPDGNTFALKAALSKQLTIDSEQIILGNGSNDILELVARTFIENHHDEIIFSQYAFAIYALITQAIGARPVITKACNYGHDLSAMLSAINKKTKIIFIANPNNPTGTHLSDDDILSFLSAVPTSVIVVLDQAYFEYWPSKIDSQRIKKYPNLILTRTFSKAYGLAGLRIGYGIASRKNSDYLNRIRQPFNVNTLAQVAAIKMLNSNNYLQQSIDLNKKGIQQLQNGFAIKKRDYISSSTNFVSVKVAPDTAGAKEKYQQLLKHGIITRVVEMPGFLRITVGSYEENQQLLALI